MIECKVLKCSVNINEKCGMSERVKYVESCGIFKYYMELISQGKVEKGASYNER